MLKNIMTCHISIDLIILYIILLFIASIITQKSIEEKERREENNQTFIMTGMELSATVKLITLEG